jgi:hypothetical protein
MLAILKKSLSLLLLDMQGGVEPSCEHQESTFWTPPTRPEQAKRPEHLYRPENPKRPESGRT